MTPTNADLRQFILTYFSDEELETLVFDYFREAEAGFGSGMSKNRKAQELIRYCETRDRLPDLVAALERERPEAWREKFGAPPAQKPSFSEETRFLEVLKRDPRQVFLSHATADADFARQLAGDLRAEGWRVWIAPDSIRPGEKWVEAIERGLETSGAFVVALTPAAVASKWVRTETNAAIDLSQADEIRFISLDVKEARLSALWRQFQYISFRGSYEAGLGALLQWLDGAAVEHLEKPSFSEETRFLDRRVHPQKPSFSEETRFLDRRVHEKTGIELIRIPAGPFLYGDDKKLMELPEFWIGRTPVTNAQYKSFLDANLGYPVPYGDGEFAKPYNWDKRKREYPTDKANHPVVLITWHDAEAFCDWAGLALPTNEQWEKAARGTDGRIWPWGDDPLTLEHSNMVLVGKTTPVDRYFPKGASPYGCADMVGNVWEFTKGYLGAFGSREGLRGGSWAKGVNRVTDEHRPFYEFGSEYVDIGFRVAAPVDSGS